MNSGLRLLAALARERSELPEWRIWQYLRHHQE